MKSLPVIQIRSAGKPPAIEVIRGVKVDDGFWEALPLRLGAISSRDGNSILRVPVERFLAARLWLRDHCINYGVGIELDDRARGLLSRARDESRAVRQLLQKSPARVVESARTIPLAAAASRFNRDLREFQARDLLKLLGLPHGANFSVPGAGKTAVTYALYEAERLRGRVERLLVVSPLSAFEAWETEADRCFVSRPTIQRFVGTIARDAEVLLVNYQRLKEPHFETLTMWALEVPTHIVLDEAHRMKRGQTGEWGRACLQLAHVATRRDILTGTPAPQSPRDFIALLEYLWPNQARAILPATALHREPPAGSMELINDALSPLFVRTTKRELGLPPPVLRVELVELDGLQADIYDALRNRYAGMFDLSRADRAMLAQMGDVTMYLLEAAANPALLAGRSPDQGAIPFRYPSLAIPPGSNLAQLVTRYHRHEIPLKFKKLAKMVDENTRHDHKTLVWSNFVGNLLTLERMLAKFRPALIYGGVPSSDGPETAGIRTREGELARFRSDPECKILLANPAALGEGVSLHEVCHDAIYLDRTFNAGQYLQSLDRIHRLGLSSGEETRITFLVTTGTIDERVDERVADKAERLASMLNDPDLTAMALPDEEDYGEAIEDITDLGVLFAHLRGDDL
ncbi:MAG: DEAD/DEAH box helicase [Chloroflexi bacterium]|nr:DEAD/DEAH box helicase [Chloroflexota bacterium]